MPLGPRLGFSCRGPREENQYTRYPSPAPSLFLSASCCVWRVGVEMCSLAMLPAFLLPWVVATAASFLCQLSLILQDCQNLGPHGVHCSVRAASALRSPRNHLSADRSGDVCTPTSDPGIHQCPLGLGTKQAQTGVGPSECGSQIWAKNPLLLVPNKSKFRK